MSLLLCTLSAIWINICLAHTKYAPESYISLESLPRLSSLMINDFILPGESNTRTHILIEMRMWIKTILNKHKHTPIPYTRRHTTNTFRHIFCDPMRRNHETRTRTEREDKYGNRSSSSNNRTETRRMKKEKKNDKIKMLY